MAFNGIISALSHAIGCTHICINALFSLSGALWRINGRHRRKQKGRSECIKTRKALQESAGKRCKITNIFRRKGRIEKKKKEKDNLDYLPLFWKINKCHQHLIVLCRKTCVCVCTLNSVCTLTALLDDHHKCSQSSEKHQVQIKHSKRAQYMNIVSVSLIIDVHFRSSFM